MTGFGSQTLIQVGGNQIVNDRNTAQSADGNQFVAEVVQIDGWHIDHNWRCRQNHYGVCCVCSRLQERVWYPAETALEDASLSAGPNSVGVVQPVNAMLERDD